MHTFGLKQEGNVEFATVWLYLEDIVLSETSQSWNDTHQWTCTVPKSSNGVAGTRGSGTERLRPHMCKVSSAGSAVW